MTTSDRRTPSRRTLLGAAAAVGTGTTLAVAAPAAAATAQIAPRRWRGEPLLTASGRHLVGRFSYGVTPALAREVRAAGGPLAWFDAQLDSDSVADPGTSQIVD